MRDVSPVVFRCIYTGIAIGWAGLAAFGQKIIQPPALQCGATTLTPERHQTIDKEAALAFQLKQASLRPLSAITYVPIRPHILRRADGTGGLALANLNNVIALTNHHYLQNGSGIQFYFAGTTPDYIDNDALYNQFRAGFDEAAIENRDVTNALNQYYVNMFDNGWLGGYAYFPDNSVASTRSFIRNGGDYDRGNRLVPHEFGHTFNLLHTHESYMGYERVTRGTGANCETAGDKVCDTPADPFGRYSGADENCVTGCPPTYNCIFTDENGDRYTPSPTNIMSYYYPWCNHDFTPGQYNRIQQGLALRLSHTAYTLDAPPTTMLAPTNLSAVLGSNRVMLTWTDNADNEMGYFVERSTSPTDNFSPIGGVAPNETTFTDYSTTSLVRYYYRIRPSNTTTGSFSNTITVLAPACRPYFFYDGCPYDIMIKSVTVNDTALSQNNGCAPASEGHYTSFTAVNGTVRAGETTTFTIEKGTQNDMGLSIWIDANNNGVFEENERLYQMPTVNTLATVSGTLTVPSSTTASTVAMRIMGIYVASPSDPCGTYSYGEAEDYRLNVIPACTTMTSLRSGNWNDPAAWSCNRVPGSADAVTVTHTLTVSANYVGTVRQVNFSAGGRLVWQNGARLTIGVP